MTIIKAPYEDMPASDKSVLPQSQELPADLLLFASKRQGFLTLGMASDYDFLLRLKGFSYQELSSQVKKHNMKPGKHLKSLYDKLQSWMPGIQPFQTAEDVFHTEDFWKFRRSIPDEQEIYLEGLINTFCDINVELKRVPLSNQTDLTNCLQWLCEEDAANLITAIRKVFPNACKPCECP